MSKSDQGKVFQDAVAQSLRIAGWRVEGEQLLGHKKVDLVAKQVQLGQDFIVAVECKHYNRPLHMQEVVKIWADYAPLVAKRLVDQVLIVTAEGFAPNALNYVESIPGLRTQTMSGILNTAIDFSSYLQTLIADFDDAADGLPHYYIGPRTTNEVDLEEVVRLWIEGPQEPHSPDNGYARADQPLAILGAYGIGKSSFATYMSATMAKEAVENPIARIPILIRLGEVAGEQTLAGLLGKHFTATYQVHGYSFNAFREMNRNGRFVVFLDGFDEMKQLLSFREFITNLGFLNELHDGASRLIILGRPTAFETDEEHNLALHGERIRPLGKVIREQGWPDYYEIELAPFNSGQMKTFLTRFLTYYNAELAHNEEEMERLWQQVNSRELFDMAKRPVQLGMLAKILPIYAGEIRDLGLAELYEMFIEDLIDQVMRREERRQARLAFTKEERYEFLCELAIWLWETQHGSVTTTDLIPLEIVKPFVKQDDWDPVDVRRDLVAGSPLDRRPGERFRFAHRSFQEFLVARTIWNRISNRQVDLEQIAPLVTDEVATFLRFQRQHEQKKIARELLLTLKGQLTMRMVRALFLDEEIVEAIHDKISAWTSSSQARKRGIGPLAPWEILLVTIWNTQSGRSSRRYALEPHQLVQVGRTDTAGPLMMICLYCLLSMRDKSMPVESAVADLLRVTVMNSGSTERVSPDRVKQKSQGQSSSLDWVTPDPDVIPLGTDYVGLRHVRSDRDEFSIGRCVGRGRIMGENPKRRQISAAPYLEVYWIPEMAIDIMANIKILNKERLDVRGLRSVFGDHLPLIAFLSDWLDKRSNEDTFTLRNDVTLAKEITLSSTDADIIAELHRLQEVKGLALRETSKTKADKERRRRQRVGSNPWI
jgi:hypothetical protein